MGQIFTQILAYFMMNLGSIKLYYLHIKNLIHKIIII